MKQTLLKTLLLTSTFSSALAYNGLDAAKDYERLLHILNIGGDVERAKMMSEGLMANINVYHPLYSQVEQTYLELNGDDNERALHKAIRYATGTKKEIYCKDKGLVFLKAYHNDGTISRMFLKDETREYIGSGYAAISRGQATYEIDTEYREPILSTVETIKGTLQSYESKERRNNGDVGTYSANWSGSGISYSYSSRGNVPEPIPMYMATDYHAWGNPTLGYDIEFKVHNKGERKTHESLMKGGKIYTKSFWKVRAYMPTFFVRDFSGNRINYKDCYQVNYTIKYNKLKLEK